MTSRSEMARILQNMIDEAEENLRGVKQDYGTTTAVLQRRADIDEAIALVDELGGAPLHTVEEWKTLREAFPAPDAKEGQAPCMSCQCGRDCEPCGPPAWEGYQPTAPAPAKDARELLNKLRAGTMHIHPETGPYFMPPGAWVDYGLTIHDALLAIQDFIAARRPESAEPEEIAYVITFLESQDYKKMAGIVEALRARAEKAEGEAKALRAEKDAAIDAYNRRTKEAKALREALERIAECQIWTGRNGAHNQDAVELQAMAQSALEKGNKNGEA